MAAMYCAAAVVNEGHGVADLLRAMSPNLPSYMSMNGADMAELDHYSSTCTNKHTYYYNDTINFEKLCS